MTKGFKRYLPIWSIIVILFNIFAWVVPFDRTELFYTMYYFAIGAFVIQLLIVFFSFRNKDNAISQTTFIYSIIGLIMMFVANYYMIIYSIKHFISIKPWIAIVINTFVLGLHYIFLLLLGMSLKKNAERDESIKDNTNLMLSLTNQVNTLYKNTKNKDIYRLYEALKYSNKAQNNNELLSDLETIVNEIQISKDIETTKENVDKAIALISRIK